MRLLLLLALLANVLALTTTKPRFLIIAKRPHLTLSASAKANSETERVVIVGGGWAGFVAADAISSAVSKRGGGTVQVDLLDASPRGQGGLAGGWRTPKGYPVEAGIHGFWREYKNTFAAIKRIGLDVDDILTDYTPSLLISESGKVALAPVLGGDLKATNANQIISDLSTITPKDLMSPESILSRFSSLLPPPLDIALLSEFNPKSPLTIMDRFSAIGLLGIWADFEQEDERSWQRYDKISAESLFRSIAGVTPALYRELVSPLLHVLPMTPGYDCSAAAALSCFHVFALQSKGAFDVRWCRGSISEKIFNPWANQLQGRGNVRIRGSAKVTSMEKFGDKKFIVTINDEEKIECDAVIMAVGGTAMKRLLPSCPPLAKTPGASNWMKFRGVTCVAVRLFLKPTVLESGAFSLPADLSKSMQESPVVVCGANIGGIPQLVETGFCVYDLTRLQGEFQRSSSTKIDQNVCAGLEVDFFRADDIADLRDDEIIKLTLRAVSTALEIEPINPSLILDTSVVRARDAVSHFCVNSASWSPKPKLAEGLYCCGDWIDRTGHASWSTEKAVVTARQAVAALAKDFDLECNASIIAAAPDTVQLEALRRISRTIRMIAPQDLIPPAPWVLAKQMQGD